MEGNKEEDGGMPKGGRSVMKEKFVCTLLRWAHVLSGAFSEA